MQVRENIINLTVKTLIFKYLKEAHYRHNFTT